MSRITKNLMNLNTEKIINEKIEIIEYLFHYIYYIYTRSIPSDLIRQQMSKYHQGKDLLPE